MRAFRFLSIAATLSLALALGCSTSEPPQQSAPAAAAPATPPPTTAFTPTGPAAAPVQIVLAPDLPPLPPGAEEGARSIEVIKATYLFAARHPETLKFVPCFCGCERMGHKDNDSCFIERRDASGKVTAWQPHGMICAICLDVAMQAMQLHNAGAPLSAIRNVIERRSEALSEATHQHTPTPPVDAGGTQHD